MIAKKKEPSARMAAPGLKDSLAAARSDKRENPNTLTQLSPEAALHLQGAALTAAANAILITDSSGAIVWVNPAFTQLSGFALAEIMGKNPRDLVKSGQHEREVYHDLWTTILSGRVWHGELVNRRKDGSLYHEEQTITPVRDARGAVTHFVAIKQDLSARKQAEEALRQSEGRYRLLFEKNPLPQWLIDPKTLRFLAVNESAVRHYGYSREEFLAMTITQIRPEEDNPKLLKFIANRPADYQSFSESRHRRKDGAIIQVEITSRPMTFEGGEARLVIAADVTEKKQLEEKLRQTQRVESVGMLAAGIAHDLNNVLAPIMFAAPLLRKSVSGDRESKILDLMELSAARGVGLVKQILGFARKATGDIRSVQVKHLAHDIIDVIEQTFPKSIRLEHQFPSDLWLVQSSPTQIHQVLLNLCLNARDAMPKGGTLRITMANLRLNAEQAQAFSSAQPAASPGAWLSIEVADSGTGIPPDVLKRIWEPFFTTKGPGEGTGLGLSTVRGIVEGHHGFIILDTHEGTGTTFRVFLPAAPEESSDGNGQPLAVPPVGNNELVLIVDDDQAVRDLVGAILVKNNYRVLIASDGLEAVGIVTAHSAEIALVITDMDMPNLNGAGLARILVWQHPNIRLLGISGLPHSKADGSGLEVARKLVHGFLVKPFAPANLLRAVHEVLQSISKA